MRDRCVVAKTRITSSSSASTESVWISGRGTMISRTWICASSMALEDKLLFRRERSGRARGPVGFGTAILPLNAPRHELALN